MEKTWKPTVAGILDIVSGALSLVGLVLFIIGFMVFKAIGGTDMPMPMPIIPIYGGLAFLFAVAIPILIAEILAIVGGIYALKRKKWGLALTGSIAALFASWPLGIAAIVFTAMSKEEFE